MADAKDKKKKPEAESEENATPVAAKGKSKLPLIIGGVVLLVVLIGAPLIFFAMKPAASNDKELAAAAKAAMEATDLTMEGSSDQDALMEGEEGLGAIYPLETFVVNLRGGSYVRCQIQFEFVGREIPKGFYSRLVPVRDTIIEILARRSAEDLSSENGRTALKSDLKSLVNEALRKEEIKNVYFTQFVVQ